MGKGTASELIFPNDAEPQGCEYIHETSLPAHLAVHGDTAMCSCGTSESLSVLRETVHRLLSPRTPPSHTPQDNTRHTSHKQRVTGYPVLTLARAQACCIHIPSADRVDRSSDALRCSTGGVMLCLVCCRRRSTHTRVCTRFSQASQDSASADGVQICRVLTIELDLDIEHCAANIRVRARADAYRHCTDPPDCVTKACSHSAPCAA